MEIILPPKKYTYNDKALEKMREVQEQAKELIDSDIRPLTRKLCDNKPYDDKPYKDQALAYALIRTAYLLLRTVRTAEDADHAFDVLAYFGKQDVEENTPVWKKDFH